MTRADISTVRISEVPREGVQAFYRVVFPKRSAWFLDHYEWHYRVGYEPTIEPLMAVLPDGRVVGQSASIPVRLRVNGEVVQAMWYIDFAVSPDMQRKGVGQLLTRAWMEQCEVRLGQPNERSVGLLEGQGWKRAFGGYRFVYPINLPKLLHHQGHDSRVVRASRMTQPLYRAWRRAFTLRGARPLELQPLHRVSSDLTSIVTEEKDFGFVRDRDWLQWRLIDSPAAADYFHGEHEGAHVVIRVFEAAGLRRAHILYMSEHASDAAVSSLALRLVAWAFEADIDMVWAISSHESLIRVFSRLCPSQLPVVFIHHASGDAKNLLETRALGVHAMDSDADIFYDA